MNHDQFRVYCSGPLFNEKEREEMQEISDALVAAGFETFLPHRDGFEFSALLPILIGSGLSMEKANQLWDKAIFALDAYQVARGCDAVVVNINGRVPDEGAVVEAALAFAAGRVVVGYKSDLRSLIAGKNNAMLDGVFGFKTFGSINAVVAEVKKRIIEKPEEMALSRELEKRLLLGKELWEAKTRDADLIEASNVLIAHYS